MLSNEEKTFLRITDQRGSLIFPSERKLVEQLVRKGLLRLEAVTPSLDRAFLTEAAQDLNLRPSKKRPFPPKPAGTSPCLVNVSTGERYYGNPGQSEDSLFESLFG